jgi:2-methylcitrate dehydratase PrpD
LPETVRGRVLFALKDHLACSVGGATTDLAVLHRRALGLPTPAEATVHGAGRATAPAAAFLNATAANAMDFDDTARHSGHPGAAVTAAALAAAEAAHDGPGIAPTGADLLAGIVAGYEVAIRVGAACRPSPAAYELVHGSQCVLPLGAAAVARVLRLDAEATARAIGIAAAWAPVPAAGKFGFDAPQLSWIKDNVNQTSETGLRAARLAALGFPAHPDALGGEKGFWRMIASDQFDSGPLTDSHRFFTLDLAFKPYPCCRWLHAALDAPRLARIDAGRGAEGLAAVRVESTAAVARAFGNWRPATMVDAQFSAPHAVAMALLDAPLPDWWRAEWRETPRVRALMDRVELAEDPALTGAFLAAGRNVNRLPARVTLTWQDGRHATAFCDHPMGEAGRPADALDEPAHFARKHTALLGLASRDAARFDAALAALPAAPSVADLLASLGG